MIDSKNRIRSYDLLRGIAIISVIAVHCIRYSHLREELRILEFFIHYGNYGVQIFFFVSALTMCHIWELRKNEPNSLYKFYVRRLIKIVPLYWISILLYLLINGLEKSVWAPNGLEFKEIFSQFIFIHSLVPESLNSIVPGGWSISVEIIFYLIFPLLIIYLKKNKKFFLIFAFIIWLFFNLILRNLFGDIYIYPNENLKSNFLQLNFFNHLPIFFLGCYMFFSLKEKFSNFEIFFLIGWIIIGILLNYYLNIKGVGYLIIYLCIYFFVKINILLNVKCTLIELIGKNSYAIYLLHFIVLKYIILYFDYFQLYDSLTSYMLLLFLVTAISYFLSLLSYFLLEKYINLFLLKKFIR